MEMGNLKKITQTAEFLYERQPIQNMQYLFNVNGGLCNSHTGFCLWCTPSLEGKQFP